MNQSDDFSIEPDGNRARIWFKGALIAQLEAAGGEGCLTIVVQTQRADPVSVHELDDWAVEIEL